MLDEAAWFKVQRLIAHREKAWRMAKKTKRINT
jgi:hypothetical protein